MRTRFALALAGVLGMAAVLVGPATARPEPRQAAANGRTSPVSLVPHTRPALPLPPNVTPALAKRLKARTRARTRRLSALNFWQWRGHTCGQGDFLGGDPGWHAFTPYGTDPGGGLWIYSRALFFSSPDLQVWSMVGNGGPWWIQATGSSSLYWWWSGSMWQGPFQPNAASTQSTYGGSSGTNYEAVVTEVWLWNGQWSGPYYNLEHASGYYALLDPNWACSVYLIT